MDLNAQGVAEMGYRTKPFHRIMERAETSLRNFLSIPDSHEEGPEKFVHSDEL